MSVSPFRGLKNKAAEIEIDGEKIKLLPEVEDAEIFISLKEKPSPEETRKITNMIVKMIKSENQEEDEDDIKAYVARHYGRLTEELAVLFGFTTRKQLDELKQSLLKKKTE